jgi:hypothetical protein
MSARQSAIVDTLLRRLLARTGSRQVFLFGPEGEPFMAARLPIERAELAQLNHALDLLERMEEAHRPKPFLASDAEHGLLVAALDEQEDLYVVMLETDPEPEPVEARAAILRQEVDASVAALLRAEMKRLA